MNFSLILPSQIMSVWAGVKTWVDDATKLNGGLYSTDDILSLLLSGQRQLWLAYNDGVIYGVLVSGINLESRKKILWIDIATGFESDRWIEIITTIEQWAKAQGVDKMWLMARVGWRRKLKNFGYKHTHEFVEKDL